MADGSFATRSAARLINYPELSGNRMMADLRAASFRRLTSAWWRPWCEMRSTGGDFGG